jgi:hypothetical protein
MSKKALIVMIVAALALTALGVAAQDSGPGVINVTLPDGKSVPVFTDGRLNAFDIGAPVVVFYTAANGNIVNPDIAPGTQPNLTNLNFSNTNTLNAINSAMGTGTSSDANANAGASNVVTAANQPDPAGLINQLQVLAVGADSGTSLVLNPSVEDLLSLVTGQQDSLSAKGYSVNFDAAHNFFWVQAPADFEGKVYTFAWPNNIFPTSLIGQRIQGLTTTSNVNANANVSGNAQATPQPSGQSSGSATGSDQATAQPTARPTTAATSTPST